MKSWARIHRDTADSRRLSELIAKHPLADALFWRIKAWADDYGRFLADPMKLAARICSRAVMEFGLPVADVAAAIDVLEELGLLRRYEVDGERYLELCDYDRHDAPLWLNVSRPEYPAPPWWTPPASLVEFLREGLHKRNVTLTRYGINESNCPDVLRHALTAVQQTAGHRSTESEQTVQQTVQPLSTDCRTDCSTVCATPSPSPSPSPNGGERARAREGHTQQVDADDGTARSQTAPGKSERLGPERGADDVDAHPAVMDCINALLADRWNLTKRQQLADAVGEAIDDPHTPCTEQEVIDSLRAAPPTLEHRKFPEDWVREWLRAKRTKAEQGARASPRHRVDLSKLDSVELGIYKRRHPEEFPEEVTSTA